MKVQKRPPKKPTRIGQRFNNAKLDKSKIKISSTIWAGFLGGFKHFQLYLATCCNHCYVYLVKNGLTWFERFFWLILIAMANYATIYVAWKSIDRYLTKNAFIGIDRDYLKWNTTLPSVTICPMERLDRQLFNAYCQTHQVTDKRRETLWDFLEHLANSTYMNFEDIPADPSIDDILNQVQLTPNKYMEVIFNLTRNNRTNSRTDLRIQCDHMGTFCHTRQILTEYGLCYLANSLLDEKYSSQYALFGTLPEANPYERKNETVDAFHITYIDKHMDYYFIGFNTSIDLYVHSPYEIMKVDNNYGYSDQNAYFDPEVVEITTEDNFERDATVRQRNCRFSHESNLTHFEVYTKNMCLQECRLRLVYEFCKCIPHFYPNRVDKPKRVCDYKTLRECFPPHKDFFLKLYRQREDSHISDVAPCFCDQNCRDSLVSTPPPKFDQAVFQGSHGAIVSYSRPPSIRYKREIYLTFTDLLVYIGGTAGFFIGFNVLGAIEIVYFFTMRLVFRILGYKL